MRSTMPTIPRIDGGADRPGTGGEGAAPAMRPTYGGLLVITAAPWLDVVRSALAPDAMAGIDGDDTSGRPNGRLAPFAWSSS
jgi:hypothetical protein